MAYKVGFDCEKYLKIQSSKIAERIAMFGGKLYLEFGGKLFDDFHASRVLPGFQPDSKIKMLSELKDDVEIVVSINASDIEKNKVRGDLGITYDMDVLRLIDAFKGYGFYVSSVVLTRFENQPNAISYQRRLESLGIKVYRHYPIMGYPHNMDLITSEEGFGKNDYIETTRKLVVVTAPGPGSGKMATCLSQLYHESQRGNKAGYAKFETFPVWSLPLSHPVNIAYEAATVDLNDINMIDPFHLEAYGVAAVNYNRDVENFPVLNAMLRRTIGVSPYKSPTDMGVNMIGSCVVDDEALQNAAKDEIVRRYYTELCEIRKGNGDPSRLEHFERMFEKLEIRPGTDYYILRTKALAEQTGAPAAAIELQDGTVITGKTSKLLGPASAMLINALKHLAGIGAQIDLLAPSIIEPVCELKIKNLGHTNPRLHTDEVLMALSISAPTSPTAACALACLPQLKNCKAHSSVILSAEDVSVFKKLGIHLTCEPVYQVKKLYHR